MAKLLTQAQAAIIKDLIYSARLIGAELRIKFPNEEGRTIIILAAQTSGDIWVSLDILNHQPAAEYLEDRKRAEVYPDLMTFQNTYRI